MDERPDREVTIATATVAVLIAVIATIATWAAPLQPDLPMADPPTYTLSALFDGEPSCVRGWTLVSAEPVYRLPYIPQLPWAYVDATEGELRAAYTRPSGIVAEAALSDVMGRLEPLARVTCRFDPLAAREVAD